MKHLKQFENNNHFKIGDYVKCVKPEPSFFLKYNKIYIVTDNTYYSNEISVEGNSDGSYHEDKFKLATPQEIEQYEIEKTSDKYNL